LPFYNEIQGVLLGFSVISLVVAFLASFVQISGNQNPSIRFEAGGDGKYGSLFLSSGILVLLLAAGKYLDRFYLLYSSLGAVSGPGWTDYNIKLPALNIIVIVTIFLGLLILLPFARRWLIFLLRKISIEAGDTPGYVLGATGIILVVLWFLGLGVLPSIFQQFRVEPNEITFEKQYINNNIGLTRYGYKLHIVEEREFPAASTFTRDMVEKNKTIFENIRLWDWRALDAVLKQFQEIRLYYEFQDVDIDRYTYDGKYRQMMISAREMEVGNLPSQSQTFVNRHFKYTHGYGVALTTVSDFTPEGLPNLLIKDIPPKSEFSSLEVERPEIYYGELTDGYVITNSSEQEFDYPSGDENVYVNYSGKGGVQISNLWRKLLYSYKFGGTKLLLSSYPTSESRIMFNREIKKRVELLAPFLQFDNDPYIVLADGELYWMVDAYTTSTHFPYSEPFSTQELIQYKEGDQQRVMRIQQDYRFEGINYIRNSVKAVVNAYDGSIDFYIFDEEDPIIQVWDKVFPGLLKSRDEMPASLAKHIRYPTDYLLIQGLVYAKYHMNDPEVFYNQEDLWIRATEKYYDKVMPVPPYYIMWELPESDQAEFSLILPFTPKNRQVLIGWIAGMCDPHNYGRFLAYNFPKEQRILGPQQVETKIDQDSFLSGQLSLWDQRGSRVIRGNVLAIPVENTLIYVEPVYLQAETAAYPELRLVCIMHEDNLSYAENFEMALEGIFKEDDQPQIFVDKGPDVRPSDKTLSVLINEANQAFENYLQATGQKKFEEASSALDKLQKTLNSLSNRKSSATKADTAEID